MIIMVVKRNFFRIALGAVTVVALGAIGMAIRNRSDQDNPSIEFVSQMKQMDESEQSGGFFSGPVQRWKGYTAPMRLHTVEELADKELTAKKGWTKRAAKALWGRSIEYERIDPAYLGQAAAMRALTDVKKVTVRLTSVRMIRNYPGFHPVPEKFSWTTVDVARQFEPPSALDKKLAEVFSIKPNQHLIPVTLPAPENGPIGSSNTEESFVRHPSKRKPNTTGPTSVP